MKVKTKIKSACNLCPFLFLIAICSIDCSQVTWAIEWAEEILLYGIIICNKIKGGQISPDVWKSSWNMSGFENTHNEVTIAKTQRNKQLLLLQLQNSRQPVALRSWGERRSRSLTAIKTAINGLIETNMLQTILKVQHPMKPLSSLNLISHIKVFYFTLTVIIYHFQLKIWLKNLIDTAQTSWVCTFRLMSACFNWFV